MREAIVVWGCRVEEEIDGRVLMGADSRPPPRPLGPPSRNKNPPLGSNDSNNDTSTHLAPNNSTFSEALLSPVFKMRSEITDLRFRIEQLDLCISWLIVLNANSNLHRPVPYMTA
jgi:hypothetical protein